MACRLIALNKNPGVRPIGIGEIARRIIAKAVLNVTRGDIQDVAGSFQLCAGQTAGTEATIHAMNQAYHSDEAEAVMLVDASNAFNALNREAALHNIRHLCPSLATILINTYRQAADLYVVPWMVPLSIPRRELHREILWACPCMPSPFFPSFVGSVKQSSKFGMLTTPLLLVK